MLTDKYLRRHTYLRLSVTDRCNLRCSYCMPEDGVCLMPHEEILRIEEFITFIDIFQQMGITKIRFTGGEPLVRNGLMEIINETANRFPHLDLAITTNGVLLKKFLPDLEKAGVKRLNISLDTLDRDRFKNITGRDRLQEVINSIEAALDHPFFNIKINTVLYQETLGELPQFLEWFRGKPVALRFIEMMAEVGGGEESDFVPAARLEERFKQLGTFKHAGDMDQQVATMYTLDYQGDRYKIGIIPPVSHGFCSRCNRLRLTADGHLKTCLFSKLEHDLKTMLRSGAPVDEIKQEIIRAVGVKDQEKGSSPGEISRTMSKIGG